MQHFWHWIVFNCKRYPPPLLASKQKGSCQHSNLSITTLHYTLRQRTTYKTKKIAKMSFKTHYHAHKSQHTRKGLVIWVSKCSESSDSEGWVDLNLSKSSAMAIDHSFQKKKECLIYNLKTVACQHNRWSSGGFYSRYVYGVLSKIYKGVSYQIDLRGKYKYYQKFQWHIFGCILKKRELPGKNPDFQKKT